MTGDPTGGAKVASTQGGIMGACAMAAVRQPCVVSSREASAVGEPVAVIP
jgi:hypothetical protein